MHACMHTYMHTYIYIYIYISVGLALGKTTTTKSQPMNSKLWGYLSRTCLKATSQAHCRKDDDI